MDTTTSASLHPASPSTGPDADTPKEDIFPASPATCGTYHIVNQAVLLHLQHHLFDAAPESETLRALENLYHGAGTDFCRFTIAKFTTDEVPF